MVAPPATTRKSWPGERLGRLEAVVDQVDQHLRLQLGLAVSAIVRTPPTAAIARRSAG